MATVAALVSDDEQEEIRARASRLGMSISDYVRGCLVIGDHVLTADATAEDGVGFDEAHDGIWTTAEAMNQRGIIDRSVLFKNGLLAKHGGTP